MKGSRRKRKGAYASPRVIPVASAPVQAVALTLTETSIGLSTELVENRQSRKTRANKEQKAAEKVIKTTKEARTAKARVRTKERKRENMQAEERVPRREHKQLLELA